uniref:Uncharacterized protein n=1 Tax=Bracon brevicornis TaxID=1563983 RepID=A0A6V7HUJ7_9HYME
MLIYPPEDKVGSPVSVYKTESFVNFCLEEIDDFGFQYDVTYVQKYRSSPWQPEEINESEVNTECFSSDDYG